MAIINYDFFPNPVAALISKEQLARTLFAAAGVWLFLFYFGRESHYVGDHYSVLWTIFNGGIIESLHFYVRPLEYFAAFLSLQAKFPVWLVFSFLAYVATSVVTVALSNTLTGDRTPSWWKILLCSASPIAPYTYFQVDMVSQALANLFTAAFALGVLHCLTLTDKGQIQRTSWILVILAAFSVLSKETSYGIMLAGSGVLLLRHRQTVVIPIVCILSLVAALVGWSLFANTHFDVTAGAHYGFKKNPLYWLFAVVFSVAVALAPVPTSLVLTGTYSQNAFTLSAVLIGAVILIVAVLSFLRAPMLGVVGAAIRQPAALLCPRNVMLLFMLFSIVPAIFFKISELYASQMLPFIKAGVIAIVSRDTRAWRQRLWIPFAIAWVLTAAINLLFYAISTGYDPSRDSRIAGPQKAIYESIEDASTHQRSKYSWYSVNMVFHGQHVGSCELSALNPQVCLPPNIASGFPSRLH
jgi:hypothetical protein